MDTSTFAALAGMGMLAMLVILVASILILGLVLSFAFRLVVGHMPSYLRALGVVVLTWIATVVASVILGLVLPSSASGLLGMIAMFLIGAAVINYLLLGQTGAQIGYGKACLVQLLYVVMWIVLMVVIGLVMAIFFGGMLAAFR